MTTGSQSRTGKSAAGKSEKDQLQDVLAVLLRDEDNKYCADCDAKSPRWASWNIGVFLCIRCAGIHRKLGVHISRVKSVNLDSWTPEQVAGVAAIGNSLARAAYEANVPDGFRRPQTDAPLEQFIKAKYEEKRYLAKDWVLPKPDPAIVFDLLRPQRKAAAAAASADEVPPKLTAPAPAPSSIGRRSAGTGAPAASQSQPLPHVPPPAKPQDPPPSEPQPPPPLRQPDLLGGLTDDGFGAFSSGGGSAPGGSGGGGEISVASDLAFLAEGGTTGGDLFGGSGGGSSGWPDGSAATDAAEPKKSMKDSIMALYASSSAGGCGLSVPQQHLGGIQYSVSTPQLAQQQAAQQHPSAALYSQAAGALYSTGGQFAPAQYGGGAVTYQQAQQVPQPQQYYYQPPGYVNNQSAYLQQIQSQMASMSFKGAPAVSGGVPLPMQPQQLPQPQQQQQLYQQQLPQSTFAAGNFWN